MKKLNRITRVVAFICLILCSVGNARTLSSVEITTQNTSIRVGEPLIVKLTYKFEQPLILAETNKVSGNAAYSAFFQVNDGSVEGGHSTDFYPLHGSTLLVQDIQGLEYSGSFVMFYDHAKKKLLFDKPGTYTLTIVGDTKASNNLSITVASASYLEEEALSLFTDPNNFYFLEFGSYEGEDAREKSTIQLKKVVEQKPTTMLAKWSAGRLGIEYFKEFHKKYPSFQKFKTIRKQTGTEEALFDQTLLYLNKAVTLPDEFSIKEEVLYKLSTVAYINNDYKKANMLLDELENKYPQGVYGKKAKEAKNELEMLRVAGK
jgi:hypothetical protein